MIPITERKQIRRPLSKLFPKTHPRAGEETNFFDSIINGDKKHTLRKGFDKWKAIADKVNAGTHVLVFFEWTGKPYYSPQNEVLRLYELTIEPINILYLVTCQQHEKLTIIANNDGLDKSDFDAWFRTYKLNDLKDMAIVYFNDFRYDNSFQSITN